MNAWIDHLAQQGATLAADTVSFADPCTEAGAAAAATIVVPLLHLGVIRSVGADSAPFLHNLVSNEVNKLAADGAGWNSFNSPKGRMIASFLLWPEAGGHALALSADILPAFLKKLSMYVLRSKARLADTRATTALIGLAGPNASAVLQAAGVTVPPATMQQSVAPAAEADVQPLRCIRIGEAQFVLVVALAQAAALFDACVAGGAIRAGTAAWELTMIRAGLPRIGAATQEEFVAQMLNFDLIGGVSFHKGCYPGQEIVARTQYLGKLKKRLYRLSLPAANAGGAEAVPGTDLFAPDFGEQPAGKIVNLAPAPDGGFEMLAVLQNSSVEAGEIRLGSPQGPLLQRLDLPYPLLPS